MIGSKDITIAWVLTLLLSCLPAALLMGMQWQHSLILIFYSLLFSTPYFLINFTVHLKKRSYLYSQKIHFTLFVLTIGFMYLFSQSLAMLLAVLAHYFVGVLVQRGLFIMNKEETVNAISQKK